VVAYAATLSAAEAVLRAAARETELLAARAPELAALAFTGRARAEAKFRDGLLALFDDAGAVLSRELRAATARLDARTRPPEAQAPRRRHRVKA
jgi:hypothetical protein